MQPPEGTLLPWPGMRLGHRANIGCCCRMPGGEPWAPAGEQQEPGRLEPCRWNPLSPADPRALPGHPGRTSCRPAGPFPQAGTLLTEGQGGSRFSPRAFALLRPTGNGV
ncbi:unnamed protein product [Coccothraustes coccothraustes]